MTPPRMNLQPDPNAYSPASDDRRATRPDEPRDGSWLGRLGIGNLISIAALLSGLIAALGYSKYSPAALDARLTATERRVDTLFIQQTFTAYMLCDGRQRSDPRSVPTDCNAILESWRRR